MYILKKRIKHVYAQMYQKKICKHNPETTRCASHVAQVIRTAIRKAIIHAIRNANKRVKPKLHKKAKEKINDLKRKLFSLKLFSPLYKKTAFASKTLIFYCILPNDKFLLEAGGGYEEVLCVDDYG